MDLKTLLAGTDNFKEIVWPKTDSDGNKIKLLLRVLSDGERQQAIFAAEKYYKAEEVSTSAIMADAFNDEHATQLLWRALRSPDDRSKNICPSISDFREILTRPIKYILLDEYYGWEAECSPNPEAMTQESFDALMIDLKKKPRETLGSLTSLGIVKRLLLTLVSPQLNLPVVNG